MKRAFPGDLSVVLIEFVEKIIDCFHVHRVDLVVLDQCRKTTGCMHVYCRTKSMLEIASNKHIVCLLCKRVRGTSSSVSALTDLVSSKKCACSY